MTIGVDGTPGCLQLGPPVVGLEGEKTACACEGQQHVFLQIDNGTHVAISIVQAAKPKWIFYFFKFFNCLVMLARGNLPVVFILLLVEHSRHNSEYIQGHQINSTVYQRRHKRARLFYIMGHFFGVLILHHASIVQ